MNSPFSFFSELTDPRVERTKAHMLEDILFIAIASVICGAESWNDMENFGKAKQEWLRTFLRLPGGIPSSAFREASLPMTRLTACSPPSIPKNWNPLSLPGLVLLRN